MENNINCSTSTKAFRSDFKHKKVELLDKGYPINESLAFVKDVYEKIRPSIIKNMEHGAILFVAPSSSHKNILPGLFARLIQRDLKDSQIVNLNNEFAHCTHMIQAKKGFDIGQRQKDPIDFVIDDPDRLKELSAGKKVYVIDDICTTGETAINLSKRINQIGVPVNGITVMVSSDKYLMRQSDKNRLMTRFSTYIKDPNVKPVIEKDIDTFLGGYPRAKCTSIERQIAYGNVFEALNTIQKGARLYRQTGLDRWAPSSTLDKSIQKSIFLNKDISREM